MGEINVGGIRIGVSLATEQAVKGLENLSRDLKKFGKDLKSAGKDLSLNISAPLAALGVVAAKAHIDFESAFAGVRKTVTATEPEFKKLEKGILDMSKRLPTSAVEIAKVAENAGQLAIKKENILEFTETMVRLGDSTNVTAGEASIALAQLANVTKLPQDQFDNLASSIVALGNNSATMENKIIDMAQRIGAAGSQAGLTQGEIIGLSAALASTGVEAEAGGTAIVKVLGVMDDAVRTNSKSLKDLSTIAGTDFKKAFQEDASNAFTLFVAGLADIDQKGKSVSQALDSLQLGEVRTSLSMKNLSQNVELLATSFARGNLAFASNSALMEESEKRYKTLASQLGVTKNILFATANSFGAVMAPAIGVLNTALRKVFEFLESLSTPIKETIVGMGAMAAAIGPVVFAVGTFSVALSVIAGAVGVTKVALLSMITLWGGLAVAAVGSAIYFRKEIVQAFMWVEEAIFNLGETNNKFWAETFPSALNTAIKFVVDFVNKAKNLFAKLASEAVQPFLDIFNHFNGTNFKLTAADDFKAPLLDVVKYQKKEFNPTQSKVKAAVDGVGEAFDQAALEGKALLKTFQGAGDAAGGATKDIKETEKALDSLNKKIEQAAQNDNEDFITANLQGAIDANAPQGTIESLQNQLYEITRSTVEQAHLDAGGVINDETKKSIDQLTTYEYKKKLESFRVNAKKEESILEDSFKRLPDFLAKGITDALINGLDEGFSSDTFKDLGKSIGAVFADSFQTKFKGLFEKGAFDNLLSGSFSDFLTGSGLADLGIAYGTTSLANNLSDNKKDPVGGVVAGAALGASIGSIVPGIGTAIGALVGAAGGFVAGSIGKNNDPGARKRKDTINFIEGKIANSYLPFLTEQGNIILGDSKRFNIKDGGSFFSSVGDLVVDAYTAYATMGASLYASAATGTDAHEIAGGGVGYQNRPGEINGPEWGQQFENQFQTVFNSFNALGGAMSQFSGQTQDEAAKIGVVLAENLNGNLDNARMLLQSMGAGATDLEEAFLQIGLSGEQSWHTVEIYMQSISDLTGEGLIGVGDLQGAFGQLTDSAGRGQAALFALQNLAIEAQEKGINNISELRAAMLSSGEFSESDVNILFQAIEQRGITTLEGLQGASQRLLGGVIADLESLGFGWTKFNEIANQASLTLSELEQKMNELNDTTIDLNIRVNYQENDKPDTLGDAEILANKNGNIFEGSTIKKFAKGGIFDSTTMFGYGNKLGMLGEAGPEAVMPLMRKNGKLGVMAQPMGGGQGMVINIDARGAERGVERNIMAAMSQMEDRILGRAMRAMSRGY